MYKLIALLKKKPGMSREAFMDYYENGHAPFALPMLPGLRRYVRRYPATRTNPITALSTPIDFDVMMEMWFDDEAAYLSAMEHLSKPENAGPLAEDEEKLFDRTCIRIFSVEEKETDLGWSGA